MAITGARTRRPTASSRHQRDHEDQESITSNKSVQARPRFRIWRETSEDRREFEKKLEDDSRKIREVYQTGFRQGIFSVRYIHDQYVSPKLLGPTFGMGSLACLTGIVVDMILFVWLENLDLGRRF